MDTILDFTKYDIFFGKGVPSWPAFSNAHPVMLYFHTPHTRQVSDIKKLNAMGAYFE